MTKEIIMQIVASLLDKVLTDEFLAEMKAKLIVAMEEAASKTEVKIDDYLVSVVKKFLEA